MPPPLNRAMTAFFSAAGMRECSRPMVMPGNAALSASCVAVALVRSSTSLSSIRGQTQYTWRPCASCPRIRSTTSSRRLSATSFVTTGVRPGGNSSMVETSRSA